MDAGEVGDEPAHVGGAAFGDLVPQLSQFRLGGGLLMMLRTSAMRGAMAVIAAA